MKFSKIEPFSDKFWKELNKLSGEDKKAVMHKVLDDAINAAMLKVSTNSTISGMYFKGELFYTDYVQKLDEMESGSDEWYELVNKLFSDIRLCHVNYQKYRADVSSKAKSEEVGNNED